VDQHNSHLGMPLQKPVVNDFILKHRENNIIYAVYVHIIYMPQLQVTVRIFYSSAVTVTAVAAHFLRVHFRVHMYPEITFFHRVAQLVARSENRFIKRFV
jgi:hypothetical protein